MEKAINTSGFNKSCHLLLAALALSLSLSYPLIAQNAALDVQNNNAANPIFRASANAGTERVTILDNGNVGIGTSTPTERLHLVGNMRFDGTHILIPGTGFFDIAEGGDIRFTIDADGQVGIGNVVPTERLVVGGNILCEQSVRARGGTPGFLGDNNNGFSFSGNGGDFDGGMFSTGDGLLEFYTNNVERFRVNASGNFGIGTSSPTERLHVMGNILSGQAVRARGGAPGTAGANNNGFSFSGNGGDEDSGMFSSANGQVEFFTNSVERMRINDVGSVGIGTATPNTRLSISPSTTEAKLTLFDAGLLTAHYGLGVSTNQLNYHVLTVADSHVFFSDGKNGDGTELMRIRGNGNVGIGTTSPMQRLHVVGNICATGSIGACSDRRYKHDFQALNGALASLTQLRGLRYRWQTAAFPEMDFPDAPQIGFIAQEVEAIFPEVVSTDANGYKSVDYARLTPVLVEALKEQQAQIEALKADIAELKRLTERLLASGN